MATARDVLAVLEKLAGEDEAVVGSNTTTVNTYFNARGQAYCGYSLMYACKKAGSNILAGCSNPAYVPTLKTYLEGKGWRVPNNQAQPGDIFIYTKPGGTGTHTGFVFEPVSGSTIITLEGNNGAVKKTAAEARNGTGTAFEGIGYRRLTLDGTYTVYRPAYDGMTTSKTAARKTPCTVSTFILRSGNEGEAVKTLQAALGARGYSCGTVDGEFGVKTLAALKSYQAKNGLEADGEAGSLTWAKLLKL